MTSPEAHITVQDLTMAYGSFVIQHDLTFTVQRGDIFIIMGGSGCGKSTLLRHLIGLNPPAHGEVLIGGENLGRPRWGHPRFFTPFLRVGEGRHGGKKHRSYSPEPGPVNGDGQFTLSL
jgi:ABC-type cobalamin/Fe3+-siderophores transport system ATPase subunit